MSQQFLGEIRLVGFNFAPVGWALCNGALLSISQNSALFNLIGTTYGGDGQETFALPNLQSRVPIHMGSNGMTTNVIGQYGGVENVTLITNHLPIHTHPALASGGGGTSDVPTGNVWANWTGSQYTNTGTTSGAQMLSAAVSTVGSSLPHDNIMPCLAVNFIIATEGIYPSQS